MCALCHFFGGGFVVAQLLYGFPTVSFFWTNNRPKSLNLVCLKLAQCHVIHLLLAMSNYVKLQAKGQQKSRQGEEQATGFARTAPASFTSFLCLAMLGNTFLDDPSEAQCQVSVALGPVAASICQYMPLLAKSTKAFEQKGARCCSFSRNAGIVGTTASFFNWFSICARIGSIC